MLIAAGARIGVYEITSAIGAGGMGEVYRARDTKLNRDVALKILPEFFASDPDRLMRFEREAQTLAALNHPHIAQIYGVEEGAALAPPTGGTDAPPSVRALVMELVEGEDLAERIARGAIPLDEELPIARQIAEALAAAHEAGIIHRDLKPANIKVRADGTVKVLDFGLAKSGAPGAPGPPGAAGAFGATVTSPAMTMQGVILGTAAYMAPEQAKGKPLDKRADIWAFGCVLYEMLTGRRAFEGDDVSDTLAAVLRGEPDWSALPSLTPHAVTTMVKRCLERDARRRVADVSTVRFVLDEHHVLGSAAPAVASSEPAQLQSRIDTEVAHAQWRLLLRRVVPIASLLVIAIGALGFIASRYIAPAAPAQVMRFAITPQSRQISTLVRTLMAISPDGSQLVYLADSRAYLRPLSDFQERVIPTPELGRTIISPAFSPDGNAVAFYSGAERLVKKIELRGGPPQRVCSVPTAAAFGLTWDVSGILVGAGPEGIFRCDPSGSAPEKLVTVENGEEASSPSLLPDGDGLLFAVAKASDESQWDTAQIVVQSLSTGARKTLVSGGSDPRYVVTGHLLYTFGGVLYAMPFDAQALASRGPAVPVIEGIRRSGGSTHLSISTNGVAAYIAGPLGATSVRSIGVADRAGVITPLPIPAAAYNHVRASRDGSRLAIGTDGEQGIVWIYPLAGSAAMQRLTLGGNNRYPIWSPDGNFVAFQSDRGDARGIYRQRVDGTGGVERLTTSAAGETHTPESWSPDGRFISFSARKDGRYSLRTVAVDSKRVETFDDVASTEPASSQFSPDGKWIAFVRAPNTDLGSSDRGVFVRPFPAGESVYQAPRQMVDFHPVWSSDGRELVYVASTTAGQMAAVRVDASSGMTFGAPSRFPTSVTGDRLSGHLRAYDLLPDGRFVGLITEEQSRRAITDLRVIVNWFEELRAK